MILGLVVSLVWVWMRFALLYYYKVSAAFRLLFSINIINKTIIIMVKQNLLTKLLLLFALIVGSTSVWADNSTLTPSSDQIAPSDNHFTVTYGGSGSDPAWQTKTNVLRLYAKNTITFTSKNHEAITNISFSATVNANNKGKYPESITASIGTITPNSLSTGAQSISWAYSEGTEEVVLTIGGTAGNIEVTEYVITYTTGTSDDSREEANISFETTSYEITLGDSFTAPTLSNPNELTVSYSSNNSDVAEVDATTGVVTVKAVGSATITASFAGNDVYKPGSVSYTLTVKKAPGVVVDGVFDFTYEDLLDYGTGLQPSTTDIKEAKTFTAGNITLTPEPTANNKYWRWWTDGTLRLYTDTKMTIAAPDGYVITKIEFVGTQNLDAITVSGGDYTAVSDKKSATWTGAEQSIVFTRNGSNPFFTKITVSYTEASVPASITAAGYATFSSTEAVDFSNTNLTVYTAKDNGTSVTLNEVESKKVPANTAVVLEGAEGDYTGTVVASADALTNNDLKVAEENLQGNGNIYVLNKVNGKVGFYKLSSTGTLEKGKAYLETENPAPFLGFDGEDTTGINSVERGALSVEGCYTLDGRRVAQPTKGLYIVNGKKVIIK